jgi:hypothetical protein
MPTKKSKKVKVRDQRPKHDPKGGMRGHAVNRKGGGNHKENRFGHPHLIN